MPNSNNPPDIVIGLSWADARLMLLDCEAAQHQLLAVMQSAHDRDAGVTDNIRRAAELLEHKKRVLAAVQLALDE